MSLTPAALVVANHAGVLPFDMIMVQAGLFTSTANIGICDCLALIWSTVPLLARLARKSGHTIASRAEAAIAHHAAGLSGFAQKVTRNR